MPIARLILLLGVVALTSGCAWQQQSRLERFDSAYNRADFAAAAQLARGFGGAEAGNPGAVEGTIAEVNQHGAHQGDSREPPAPADDLLWTLQQAAALQAAGDHAGAVELFDRTEDFFRRYDERGALSRWTGQLFSTLSNDAVLAYQGMVYDAIMVNSYKALNFMAQGLPALARVELNRARDRQRRAANYFADELAEARDELARRNQAGSDAGLRGQGLHRDTLRQALDSADRSLAASYGEAGSGLMAEWAIYPDFINPLATYLQGLYLLTHAEAAGDYGRAADALREVQAMVPTLEPAAEDWRWAEDLASGRRRLDELPPTVWILYENGQGPVRKEQRIQLPFILFNRNGPVFWAGLAYPLLSPRNLAQPALSAWLADAAPGPEPARTKTQTLVNMDAVVGAEFRQRLPTVMTRAVITAATKAAAQYQLQKEAHPLVALLGFLYQIGSTQADTRQWTSLPKTIELAKLPRPVRPRAGNSPPGGDGSRPDRAVDQLRLAAAGERLVDLPDSYFTLVWVRQPSAAVAPAITVMPLGDRRLRP